MRTALLALFGFFSFTIACPIAMGIMPVDMGEMPEMSHVMNDDKDKGIETMSCEQCKKEKQKIAVSFSSQTEVAAPVGIPATLIAFWELAEPLNTANPRMLLLTNGPPFPTE
ncbi:hypothetical protein HYS30_02080, partial [Candidatus Peregrinibacteria bacterium]|nr:hypothetical protein [Candidatus Peregrinibacteria bacterium]